MKNKNRSNKVFSTFCAFFILTLSGCSMFRPATQTTPEKSETEQSWDAETVTTAPETNAEITEETVDTALPVELETTVVSFLGAGDNIIYYGNVRDAASCTSNSGRTYNFAPMYTDIASLVETADISFINQETLMCGEGYKLSYYPRFNSPQDLAYDLAELGFDVVNIANNHMLDKGADGLAATISFWNTFEDITLLGGYTSEEDYETLRIVERNGVRVAFLSYTFHTNSLSLPASSSLVIPYPDDDTVISQLSGAKEAADYVIVSVHWGDEYVLTPNDEQRSFAALLAEYGADAIIGHHPHVIQPIEWIERADGGRTLCVYSLGNLVAEMDRDTNMLGGLISFDIVKCGDSVTTENVVFIPTVYYFTTSFYKNHVYLMSDFTDELAASHGLAYYGRSLSLPTLRKYLNSTISDEFLPEQFQTSLDS